MAPPFRELFVELGRDVFEIVKAIGEEAVAQGQRKGVSTAREPDRLQRMLAALSSGPGACYLLARYGWSSLEFERLAFERAVAVRARLDCGHGVRLSPISEIALVLADRGEMVHTFIDLIDRRVLKASRCYCVPREAVKW